MGVIIRGRRGSRSLREGVLRVQGSELAPGDPGVEESFRRTRPGTRTFNVGNVSLGG